MSNEPGPAHRGLMLVVSSPSGAGKTSLCRRLLADQAGIVASISATTRPPRPGEVHGRDYLFITPPRFEAMVRADAFLEWAEVHEHRYGSPRAPTREALAAGRDVLFDIDWQGARAIAAAAPEDTVRVFILPPTMAELSKRLLTRAHDATDVIARRLARAKVEIEKWPEYDYVLVNDDFETAYAALTHIYRAERLKCVRNPWVAPFARDLLRQTI